MIFILAFILAFLNYFDYVEPLIKPLHLVQETRLAVSGNVILGNYPRYDDLERLKEKENVKVVISLLDTNLPQEKALFEREKENAARIGIEVVSFPMRYIPTYKSDANRQMVQKLIAFAGEQKGKRLYVHCYLARHRTVFVREVMTEEGYIFEVRLP